MKTIKQNKAKEDNVRHQEEVKTKAGSNRTAPYPAQTLNEHRYAETFEIFVRRSTEYGAMIERLVRSTSTLPRDFTWLDVGAGNGTLIRNWIEKTQRYPGLYVAIEPNEEHSLALKATLADLQIEGEVVKSSFSPTFEFPSERTLFDFVLFSHSLYHMPDASDCVKHAMEWLTPNGIALIFIQGPFGFYTMHRLFNPLLRRDEGQPLTNHGVSSHEIIQGLRQEGLEPTVHTDEAFLDLTGIFDPGMEQERDGFISFNLQAEFALIEKNLRTDIIQYLKDACYRNENGRKLLHHPTMAIEVRKPLCQGTGI